MCDFQIYTFEDKKSKAVKNFQAKSKKLPRAKSDLLMFAPSLNLRAPLDDVTDPRSEPAKSIIESLATFMSAERPEERLFNLM